MVELLNIHKSYEGRVVLNNFSLTINDGEFIVVTGPSGCGKSTLLNILGLLEKSDSGQIIIDEEVIPSPRCRKATKILREKISYLFQNFALIDEETVFNNLILALRYVKGNKKKLITEALSRVGLEGYEHKKIYQLSGGEQQRVAIARLLLKPGEIILADEPTGSLDRDNRDLIIRMLQNLNRDGKTVLIVTHDQEIAMKAGRVIHLNG